MVKKAADNVGADRLSLWGRFMTGSYLLVTHIARFFSSRGYWRSVYFLSRLAGFYLS